MNAISVVMAVYNTENTIAEAIESILNQSFSDFEFIIVNDGSTDNTRSVVCSYNDKRIRLIDNTHDYIQSLNTGMKASTGKYIARMDADDICHIDRLKIQHTIMEAFPEITVCCSWMNIFGENVPEITVKQPYAGIVEHPLVHLLTGDFVINPTAMIKSSFLKEHNLLYEDYTYAEDYKFWIEAARMDAVFYVESQPLIYRRVSDSQVTNKYRDIQKETTSLLIKETFSLICHKYGNYHSLKSFCNALYDLLDQQMITEKEMTGMFHSLFLKNREKFDVHQK